MSKKPVLSGAEVEQEQVQTVVLAGWTRRDIAGYFEGASALMESLGYDPRVWQSNERRTLPVSVVARLQNAGMHFRAHLPDDGSIERKWTRPIPPRETLTAERVEAKRRAFLGEKQWQRVLFHVRYGLGEFLEEWSLLGYPAEVRDTEIRMLPASLVEKLRAAQTRPDDMTILPENSASAEQEALQLRFVVVIHREQVEKLPPLYSKLREKILDLDAKRAHAIVAKDWKTAQKIELETRLAWLENFGK